MLSRLLRQILFYLIHFFVSVLVAVQKVYRRTWVKKDLLLTKHKTKSDIEILLENLPRMRKKLIHLVVLVDTNHHSMTDLAYLVIWSLIAGVPYVSFYDIRGELNKNDEKLFLEIERHKKGIPGCIKWAQKPDLNGYTNGNTAHTLNLNIFSYNDGRSMIAKCVQKIVQGKLIHKEDSKELTVQELNESLASCYPKIPDPELTLYSGPLCCTYGLLPWQIRLTEFVQISLDYSIDVYSYVGALYRYNRCSQRFGK